MNDARTHELVDLTLAGGDDAARSLIALVGEVAKEPDADRRERTAHGIACAAFSHSRTHDAALEAFVEDTHSRAGAASAA
jgi:hypothetical protein